MVAIIKTQENNPYIAFYGQVLQKRGFTVFAARRSQKAYGLYRECT
jgi:hypothetical protein